MFVFEYFLFLLYTTTHTYMVGQEFGGV